MPSTLLSSSVKRWTLAVVCAATAMLMLDIAVVNTALSRIAADLHTDLAGLQWIVDAYTLALASTVLVAGCLADRLGRRRVFTFGISLFTLASAACALATDITALDVARAVQGIGAAVMFAVSLSLLAHAFPGEKERAGALAAYGATIGGTFAIGPLVGGSRHRPRLAVDLRHQHPDRHRLPVDHAHQGRRVTRPGGTPDRLAGPGHAERRPVPARARAAARQRRRLGLDRSSPSWSAPASSWPRSWRSSVASRIRCCRSACSATASFTGAQVGAFAISASFFAVFLYLTLYLQQVLGLSAIASGATLLPGTIVMFLVAGASSQLLERISARTMIAVGPRARRRRPGAAWSWPRSTRRGRSCCRARSSR